MKTFPLSQLARIEKGKQIDTRNVTETGKFRYINGGIKESGYYDRFNSSGPCVLISEGGASCGYVNYVDENFWCGCHCYRLSDIKARPKYLFYALKANQMALMNLRTGAAMPNIKKKTLCNMPILIDENAADQEDVVRRLCLIQSAIDTKKKENEGFDALIKSRFMEMFNSCKKANLCDVAEITMGQSPDSISYNDDGDGMPFFQGKADYGDKYIKVTHWTTRPTKIAYKNSVLMSVRAPVGPVNIASCDCCIGRGLCSINAIEGKTNNEFLYAALNLQQNEISQKGTGSTFKAISKNEVYQIQMPVAKLDLQNEFSSFSILIDKSRFVVQQQIKDLQELLDSKMDEYFGQ